MNRSKPTKNWPQYASIARSMCSSSVCTVRDRKRARTAHMHSIALGRTETRPSLAKLLTERYLQLATLWLSVPWWSTYNDLTSSNNLERWLTNLSEERRILSPSLSLDSLYLSFSRILNTRLVGWNKAIAATHFLIRFFVNFLPAWPIPVLWP